MADYQYRLTAFYNQDPTPGYELSCDVDPADMNTWQNGTGGVTVTTSQHGYRWHDSNIESGPWTDSNSSRAVLAVQQSWTPVIDPVTCKLTVSVYTKMTSLERDLVQGYPGTNTPCRDIEVISSDNVLRLKAQDCQVASAPHAIALNTGYSFPIEFYTNLEITPNSTMDSAAFWVKNQTTGAASYDMIWAGVTFKNNYQIYQLHYNANGGSGAPASQVTNTTDDSVTFTISSTKPTWSGHRFDGWSEDPGGAGTIYQGGDTFTVYRGSGSPAQKTLYAVWTPDYRPGAALDTNTNIWKSHNRTNGACHVLSDVTNMTWQECRTVGGAEGYKGNPPLILTAPNANSWRDQKLLGKE